MSAVPKPPWPIRGLFVVRTVFALTPDAHTGRSVANYLWGLLPDNELTLATWARHFQVSARNPIALLSHVGEACAGAVQFLREDRLEALSDNAKPLEIEWLTEKDVAHRMGHLIRDAGAARESIAEGQFSLSGAQAKTAYFYDCG